MSIKLRITEDVKTALRAQDKRRVSALRLITAAFKQIEVDQRIEIVDDTQVIDILTKMIKQRRDALEQFRKAQRTDLADQEQYELDLIQAYLPQALSEQEVKALVDEAVATSGAATIKDMGKVMALVKPKIQGRADMAAVSQMIKARLS